MKVRADYVTNSSSSSFIIATRESNADVRGALEDLLALPEGHPFAPLVKGAVEVLLEKQYTREWPDEEDDRTIADLKRWYPRAWELYTQGWSAIQGSVTNEGEPEEYMLVDLHFNHMDEERGVYIWKEPGY